MFDGDKLLVTDNKTLVNAAERNNKNRQIVPLFYNMSKAKAEILSPETLYKGLELAYTGGNIGEISNAITKIWNSGEITDEKIKVIKWLVMINNFVIDYAKTLYKPIPPESVTKIIANYTKSKTPAFFKYAKGKTENKVEPISDSAVNRIHKLFKKRKLNYNFKKENVGSFNYRVLMSNPDIEFIQEIADKFKEISSKLNFSRTDDKKYFNQYSVYEEAKSEMLNCQYDINTVVDVLILDLFKNRKTPRKKAFWTLFGDVVYENICNNINDNFVLCERCHKRYYKSRLSQKYCPKCQGYQKMNTKMIVCLDCGNEFEVDSKNNKAKRCSECQHNEDKRIKREYWHKTH